MAHFAKIENGIVTRVIVAEAEFFNTFSDTSPGRWVQTSYNTRGGIHYAPNSDDPDGGEALRKNYAGVDYIYDKDKDAFYEPKPYPSWVLDEATCYWNAPTPRPDDGKHYIWNESTTSWDEV